VKETVTTHLTRNKPFTGVQEVLKQLCHFRILKISLCSFLSLPFGLAS